MNLNILAYTIYLPTTIWVVYVLGKICYYNGNIYVNQLVPNHQEECLRINKMLLVAFYLMNMGYCFIALVNWNKIESIQNLIEVVSVKIGFMILLIAFMHYFNLFWITKFGNKLINKYL
jgi:uncharacterized membrane protein